jgi:hypothetical protein
VGAGLVAIALLVVSVALWVDPAGSAFLPFTPAPLSGRVLGGWTFLLAVLAASIAVDGDRRRGRLPALAMVAFPAGALIGMVRTSGQLGSTTSVLVTAAAAVAWLALGVGLLREAGRPEPLDEPIDAEVPIDAAGVRRSQGRRTVATTARWSLTDVSTTSAAATSTPFTAT